MNRGRSPASHSSAKLADRARVDALRSLLAGFMPAILASGVVRAALKAQGQHDDACSAGRFADVVSHCRVGLSLFVAPARLPELMLALADLIEQHEQGAALPACVTEGLPPRRPARRPAGSRKKDRSAVDLVDARSTYPGRESRRP